MSQEFRLEVASYDASVLFTSTIECEDVNKARSIAQKVADEFKSSVAIFGYAGYLGVRSPAKSGEV